MVLEGIHLVSQCVRAPAYTSDDWGEKVKTHREMLTDIIFCHDNDFTWGSFSIFIFSTHSKGVFLPFLQIFRGVL